MKDKRAVRIGKLTTVGEVAHELGRLYRAARRDEIDSTYANRLANVLSAMRQCLETAEIESRIKSLEEAVLNRAQTFKPRVIAFPETPTKVEGDT